ncbi:MAG TPA: PPC domain-containing DNA-binding protein [Gemmatimonadaceae bacterium]|nr:PPC domain-containing DNA-binding protein [Gemmatimonadaceae bacterium]
MKSKLLSDSGERTFAIVFDAGDEAVEGLTAFAKQEGLRGSHFTGIGAFRDAVLGYFDWETKEYQRIPVDEQVEVLSLVGDIALSDGKPAVHAHVTLGKADGSAHGGHLLSAHVRPTLEVVLAESPQHLRRTPNAESGLPLIDLDQ